MSNIIEGVIRGKTIELQSDLGFKDGEGTIFPSVW